jgi:serine protease AprX
VEEIDQRKQGESTMGIDRGSPLWRRSALRAVLALLVAAGVLLPATFARADSGADSVSVIVREVDPPSDAAENAVESLGGIVGSELAIVGGFSAEVPLVSVSELAGHQAIVAITPDATLQLSAAGWEDGTNVNYNSQTFAGTVPGLATGILQAGYLWDNGYTGQGIDIALIDSGVVPVNGLTASGKIINGPDLSFESQADHLRYLDSFGHGTHMAGIIAGRDDGAPIDSHNNADFLGVAPGSRILSLKVADYTGATDVSQVIAAIDWVVQHRNDNGMNVRVLNLSFGTDSAQSYVLDPLAFAVEQAWNAGIVVVVAAGNDGNNQDLRNPAIDPFVIAVGATNSAKSRPGVKSVENFTNCGTEQRHIDVVVPGKSVASLRSPGSSADVENSEARVADRFFLGSGTSQAAAFVTGSVALLLDQDPTMTPDQVKALLMAESKSIKYGSNRCQGAGLPNLQHAAQTLSQEGAPQASQTYQAATGLGTLEGARGSDHLEHDGVVLQGEQDIFGNTWDGASWSTLSAAGASWSGGEWNGASWSGASWSGASWSGASWSGASWSGASWSGASWSGASWSANTWNGASWSGASWSGASWSGASWSGNAWLGLSWDMI